MIKQYLGDGVYAEYESDYYAVILTTENGIEVTNRIVLEAEVLEALNIFLSVLFKAGMMSKKND